MKYKFLFTFAVTAFLTFCSFGTKAFAAGYTGYLDGVSGDSVSGWAWDSSSPQSSVTVEVVVSDEESGTVLKKSSAAAQEHYSHLSAQGIGTGNYGFSADVDLSSLSDGTYTVRAYVGGTELPNRLTLVKSQGSVHVTSASSLRSLGIFKTTAYCPCGGCSEGWGRHTATGAIAASRHTIAVDPKVIPYGSRVLINGVVYTAEDRGGGVKGNHIDIFFDTHSETRQYGTRSAEVFLLP